MHFAHSSFSLRYGTLSPEILAAKAVEFGWNVLVLTDINNTSAHYDFTWACKAADVRPVLGMELRDNEDRPLYVCLALNNRGLYELNSFFTNCSRRGAAARACA